MQSRLVVVDASAADSSSNKEPIWTISSKSLKSTIFFAATGS